MSNEIVTQDDGTLWVIDGQPGHYRARRVHDEVAGTDPKKYLLRRRILDGELDEGGGER